MKTIIHQDTQRIRQQTRAHSVYKAVMYGRLVDAYHPDALPGIISPLLRTVRAPSDWDGWAEIGRAA